MTFDWIGLAVAVGICVSVAVLEGAITPDAVGSWYPTLNKPWWNLPFAAFVAVAIVVYVIDGFVAYRLWAVATLPGSRTIGLTALVVVMVFWRAVELRAVHHAQHAHRLVGLAGVSRAAVDFAGRAFRIRRAGGVDAPGLCNLGHRLRSAVVLPHLAAQSAGRVIVA